MTTSWHDEPGTSTPCQRVSVPNRQVVGSRANCADQGGDLVLPLAEDLDLGAVGGEPGAQLLGGVLGGPRRGEQPERAPARGPHERLDLVEDPRRRAVAARRREVLGDVDDGLPRVVEGAADVEAPPRRARPSPRSPMVPATASKLPPSSSVALVSTTVRSPKTLSRTSIATLMGATRSTGPRRGSLLEPDDVEVAPLEDARGCSRTSRRSAARATWRAPSAGSPGGGLSSDCTARVVSRTRLRARTSPSDSRGSRPSVSSSSTPPSSTAASSTSPVLSASRPARRAAPVTMPCASSSVMVAVTRSTSSCASSTTSTSCSGSICRPSKASMAMNEWLVTMTSTSLAASRERSTKHSATRGHVLPRHSCGRHRHLPPGALAHPGHELVAVAGLGLVGPLAQPHDLVPEPRRRRGRPARRVEQPVLLVGEAALELVHADVVAPALDERVGRAPARAAGRGPSPRRGMSRSTIWACSARVAVATTAGVPVAMACCTAGTR